MAEVGNSDKNKAILPPQGRVNAVCREWLVHEDGCLAYRLQEEEFDAKYGLNRHNRRTVREDIPVVKVVQSEEEERQQIEQMEYLQRQRELADQDAEVARQMMQDLEREEEEQRRQLAQQDEELARQIQDKEAKRIERKRREKVLAKQRRDLERQLHYKSEEAQIALDAYRRTSGPGDMSSLERALTGIGIEKEGALREDGRVEDVGDFSDFYIPPDDEMATGQKRELQELQDEEIARLLQEQEHKRGAVPNRDKLKEIELKDEELARVMQEQEKLKARKARHKLKQMSERHAQETAQHAVATRSHSLPDPPHESREPEGAESEMNGTRVSVATNTYLPPRPAPEHSSYMPAQAYEHQQLQHIQDLKNSDNTQRKQLLDYHSPHDHRRYDSYEEDSQFSPSFEREKARESERRRLRERQRKHEERQRTHEERQRSHDVHHGSPSSGRERQRSGSSSRERRKNSRSSPGTGDTRGTPSPQRSRRHQQSAVAVDVSRQLSLHSDHEPSSPAPPGYYGREEYISSSRSTTQDSLSSSVPVSPATNIMAAIDPTYNPNNPPTEPSPTHSISTLPNRGTPPLPLTASAAIGGEDGYCDLAESSSAFAPIQGQKRSTLKKKERSNSASKRSSCKQQ